MPLTELNHYFVRANDLERTRDFYVEVLGFEVMPRPDFPFPGYWLGINGKIQVHMGPAGIPNQEMYYLGTPKNAVNHKTGVVDHIAFLASEPMEFVDRFKKLGMNVEHQGGEDQRAGVVDVLDRTGLEVAEGGEQRARAADRVGEREPVREVELADHREWLALCRGQRAIAGIPSRPAYACARRASVGKGT